MPTDESTRVLLVEDDVALAQVMRRTLRREGYDVRHCETARLAMDLVRIWHPHIVLLDLGLPDADGRDLARQIREASDVGLVMVTGRAEESDKTTGLEIGADDYIVKPFGLPELVARIRAVLRRTHRARRTISNHLQNGPLVLDVDERTAHLDGTELDLRAKEFEVLRVLMEQPGKVVRRAELASAVWGTTADRVGKTIDVHLSWLRTKLGDDPRRPRYIETLRGVGFRLIKDVSTDGDAPSG